MDWKALGASVGKVAPLLGTALGGPGGAAVGSLVAAALHVEDTPLAISQAMLKDPEAGTKLQALQNQHAQALQEMALDTLKAELGDTANARNNHKYSKMPATITIMLTVMVAGLLWAIFNESLPNGHADLAMMMFGQVFTLWGASITYWVGTTRSSAEKDRRKVFGN